MTFFHFLAYISLFPLLKRNGLLFLLKELKMKIKKIIRLAVLLGMMPMLSGCWLLAAAGVGAYGGYKMKEDGYTLQNPVTKEKGSTSQSK